MRDAIKNYIDYLSKNHGLQISIHGSGLLPRLDFLAPYNSHECVYCMLVKTSAECHRRCRIGQERAMARLNLQGAFYGSCYAGVGEFVFPVHAFGNLVGMISVGGFLGAAEKRAAFAAKYGFGENTLSAVAERELCARVPSFSFVRTLIMPLSAMITLEMEKNGSSGIQAEALYGKILSILHTHYPRKLTLKEIADECHYSPSHVSRYFNKKSGVTVYEYLKRIRMEKAAHLLLHTEMRLEDVAASVGFFDTNYFISFFSTYYKMAPGHYRSAAGMGSEALSKIE